MKKLTSVLALFLSMVMVLSVTAEGVSAVVRADAVYDINSPSVAPNGVKTWDCVYFGNYNYFQAEGWEAEPVKWRVLSVNGNDAFLMADGIVHAKPYASDGGVCTWETSTLRTWLNQDFYQDAFSQEEQAAILATTVVNEDNADTGAEGGNDTEDKIYLLSVSEVGKAEYGFDANLDGESEARRFGEFGNSWWLRTPCGDGYQAVVDGAGKVIRKQGQELLKNDYECGVRPVLHLDLSATSVWKSAGTVKTSFIATETAAPTKKPNSTQKPSNTKQSTTTPKITPIPKKPAPKTTMKPGQKKAISSFKDLQAMENIPSGSYYLSKDITVPKNAKLFCDYPFTGTLDGRGHKIKGYQYDKAIVSGPLKKNDRFNHLENEAWYLNNLNDCDVGIFNQASQATFKNITLTKVKISANTDCAAYVAALVTSAKSCSFNNVHVSGKITVKSTRENPLGGQGFSIGGIVSHGTGKMVNCSNSASIMVNCRNCYDGGDTCVGGLAGDFTCTSLLKKCSNSGKISLSGYGSTTGNGEGHFSVAGLMISESARLNAKAKMISCTNSGNITLKLQANGKKYDTPSYNIGDHNEIWCGKMYAAGLVSCARRAISCGNTGKIKVTRQSNKGTLYLAGVAGKVAPMASRCYNKGAISYTGGIESRSGDPAAYMGGLFGDAGDYYPDKFASVLSECYNTGKISAKITNKGNSCTIGGVAGLASGVKYKLSNCYNAGNISGGKQGTVGGVCGTFETWSKYARYNYNAGTIKGAKYYKGTIFGNAGDAEKLNHKRHSYDNYYKGSGQPYGRYASWKGWKPQAKKVSSLTKANCPKLSSKYWVYSSKVKRMVLKNNNETKAVKKAKTKKKSKGKK